MKRNRIRILAWLLSLALILGTAAPAFAEEIQIRGVSPDEAASLGAAAPAGDTPAAESAPRGSILDSAVLNEMVQDYLAKKNIPADRVGIGYCYTATGDEWFHNPDTWFYPGSVYKVPLMMILAEHIHDGQVDKGTQIGGLDLDTVFRYILVNSNNDYAHMVRKFLADGQGGDEIWREEAKQYARLDSYDERYMLYCYFSPRYITQVMETLYRTPEKFPGVVENLLEAEQSHYFRLSDEMRQYEVAQKYGSYIDNEGSNWNHTTGIIYTENPFILTVMTKNVGGYESVIGDLAVLFRDYTLGVDQKLAAYKQEQDAREAEQRAAEQTDLATAGQDAQPQQPAVYAAPTPKAVTQAPQTEAERRAHALALSDRARRTGIIVLEILLAASIIGGIAAVIIVKEKERKRYESYRRRFEAEMRQEALERERAMRAQQQPRARTPEPPPETRTPRPAPAPQQPARRSAPAPQQVQRAPVKPRQAAQAPNFDETLWEEDDEDE